ncbi:MAG: cytochrome c [Pseudohongiellaceae bacterium]
MNSKSLVGLIVSLSLLSCEPEQSNLQTELPRSKIGETVRWYDSAQVALGAEIFTANCAVCHGLKAEGLYPDWKQKLPSGAFPPPPLNGTAHAWHHPLSVLVGVIEQGGTALGGVMPGFATQLNDKEKLAAIAYFQNFWSEENYENWMQMGGTD